MVVENAPLPALIPNADSTCMAFNHCTSPGKVTKLSVRNIPASVMAWTPAAGIRGHSTFLPLCVVGHRRSAFAPRHRRRAVRSKPLADFSLPRGTCKQPIRAEGAGQGVPAHCRGRCPGLAGLPSPRRRRAPILPPGQLPARTCARTAVRAGGRRKRRMQLLH